jgi:hypothetical protein
MFHTSNLIFKQENSKLPEYESDSEIYTDSDLNGIDEVQSSNSSYSNENTKGNKKAKRSSTNLRFEFSPRIEVAPLSYKKKINIEIISKIKESDPILENGDFLSVINNNLNAVKSGSLNTIAKVTSLSKQSHISKKVIRFC